MDSFDTIQILGTLLPSLITGAVAFYFFKLHLKNETHRRNSQLLKAEKKQSLPLRLQAYECIALFLECSNPIQLLVRIKPPEQRQSSLLQPFAQNHRTRV
jgi:hypothetical protein